MGRALSWNEPCLWLQENDRTYGDRAPGLLSGTKLRDYHSVQETGRHSQTHQINSLRSFCVLQLALRWLSRSTTILLLQMYLQIASSSCRYAEQLPSLTKQALALSGGSQLMESVVSITGSDARTVPVSAVKPMHTGPSSTIVTAAPSWLTPQQLQNRQLGESCCSIYRAILHKVWIRALPQ